MATSGFFRVDGPTAEIAALARRMKDAPKEMRRELPRALAGGAKIIKDAGRSEAMSMPLPSRGGFEAAYRRNISNAIITKTKRLTTNPTVEVGYVGRSVASRKGKGVAYTMNAGGSIRHPVYGNRDVWASTDTGNEGWFTGVAEANTNDALDEMQRRMTDLAQRLAYGMTFTTLT